MNKNKYMSKEMYDKYYRNLLQKASKKRVEKEDEYFSTEDVLLNLRKIGSFRDQTTPVAIMNLGTKSLQSISDMVNFEFEKDIELLPDEQSTLAQWDEKFIDAINYLFKLYASIREFRGE